MLNRNIFVGTKGTQYVYCAEKVCVFERSNRFSMVDSRETWNRGGSNEDLGS